jgi:hypothetical protein
MTWLHLLAPTTSGTSPFRAFGPGSFSWVDWPGYPNGIGPAAIAHAQLTFTMISTLTHNHVKGVSCSVLWILQLEIHDGKPNWSAVQ